MNNKKTNNSLTYNQIISELAGFFEKKITALILLAYRKGASKAEIARTIEVDQSRISQKYKDLLDMEDQHGSV